jgi:alpha-glucosidase
MPAGWILNNDGYGCGYGEGPEPFPHNLTDLTSVVAQLHGYGFTTGLWTSTGMPDIVQEVGVAGTRICKTDVGWIGAGYAYAFDGVTQCVNGIEQNCDGRRFVWTVEGWAGTHRLAVMWTGDDSGSMDYVRWQIPTFVGSGFSAQAHTSGDIDGIFGGSPESYVRDLQFKALTTTIMTMSGWAPNPDKQPWTWGEPYTTYNRAALKFKARLTPYMYSLSRQAYDTGVPPIRALLLEFPGQEALYLPTNATLYTFLSGPYLLVAPVHTLGALARDDIPLPAGTQWVDWQNGTVYEGNQTLQGYPAPLDTLPLFVRAGAILPLWPPMNFPGQLPADPMTLELWPAGNTSFELYEDDGVTRLALNGTAFARTLITLSAPLTYLTSGGGAQNVTLAVGAARGGGFAGQLPSRAWRLNIRCRSPPLDVLLSPGGGGGSAVPLPEMQSEAQLESASAGWFHNPSLQPGAGGLLTVKLPSLAAAAGFQVTLSSGPSFPHIGTEACDTVLHHQVHNQKFAWDAGSGKFTVVPPAARPAAAAAAAAAGDQCLTIGKDKDEEAHTPALEVQPCSPALDAVQQFVVLAASGQLALKANQGQCLDQDVSDMRVILYGCHDAASPGNQAWAYNATSQHVVSLANGDCMCVLPSA